MAHFMLHILPTHILRFDQQFCNQIFVNFSSSSFWIRPDCSPFSVIVSSALFGFGHIFDALGQPILTLICDAVWVTALGIYFGAVYVKNPKFMDTDYLTFYSGFMRYTFLLF